MKKKTSHFVLDERKKFSLKISSNAKPIRIRSCFINFNDDFVCSLILHQNCLISSCQFIIGASEKYINHADLLNSRWKNTCSWYYTMSSSVMITSHRCSLNSNYFPHHFPLGLSGELRWCYHFGLIPSVLKVQIKLQINKLDFLK